MDMKLWNFLERIQGIEHKVMYIGNYMYEQDVSDGSEMHFVHIDVEDGDTETIDASYRVESNTKEQLQKEVDFLKSEYFEDIEIVEDW